MTMVTLIRGKVVVSIIRGLARALVACSSFKWAFINCKLGRMMIINWTFFRVGVQQRRSLYFKFFPVPKAWTWWFWSLPPRSLNAMISRPKILETIWMTLLIYFLTLYYVKQDLWKKEKISGTLHLMIIGARVIEGQSIHRLPPRLPPKLISTIFMSINDDDDDDDDDYHPRRSLQSLSSFSASFSSDQSDILKELESSANCSTWKMQFQV